MPRGALVAILLVSALAVAFLLWLLYVHQAPAEFARRLTFLPAMNALFNAMSAMALCTGYYFIRKSNPQAHRNSMITAFCLSSLFLVSYIVNHALHGDTHYPGHGIVPRNLSVHPCQSHYFVRGCSPVSVDHLFSFPYPQIPHSSEGGPIHLSDLALCVDYRSRRIRDAASCVLRKASSPLLRNSKTARNFRAVLCVSKIDLLLNWRLRL